MSCTVILVVFIHFQRVKILAVVSAGTAVARCHAADADQVFEFIAHPLQAVIVFANHFFAVFEAIESFLNLSRGNGRFTDYPEYVVENLERNPDGFVKGLGYQFPGFRFLTLLDQPRGGGFIRLNRNGLVGDIGVFVAEIRVTQVSAVDSIGPVEQFLQDELRVIWWRGHALQRFEHGLDAIGNLLHGVCEYLRRFDLVLGDVFENILEVVR